MKDLTCVEQACLLYDVKQDTPSMSPKSAEQSVLSVGLGVTFALLHRFRPGGRSASDLPSHHASKVFNQALDLGNNLLVSATVVRDDTCKLGLPSIEALYSILQDLDRVRTASSFPVAPALNFSGRCHSKIWKEPWIFPYLYLQSCRSWLLG